MDTEDPGQEEGNAGGERSTVSVEGQFALCRC